MTLLTSVQTSSTMSTCIININYDHDHDPASPLPPPHLNSDDNNDNSRYPDHYDHLYHQQHRQQQMGSRCVMYSVSRSGPVRFFSLFWTRPGPDQSSEISFLGKNRTGLGKTSLHQSGLGYLLTLNWLRPRPV